MGDKSRWQSTQPMQATLERAPRAAVLALKPAPGPRPREERWEDSLAVISVRGDLDRDALWAIDFTVGRAAVEAGRIVLDLLEVTHLDYAGVGELVARRRELLQHGGELSIVVKNPYVANILKAAGGSELALFRTVEEASATLQMAMAGRRAAVAVRKRGT